jgi:hypothetical protein
VIFRVDEEREIAGRGVFDAGDADDVDGAVSFEAALQAVGEIAELQRGYSTA